MDQQLCWKDEELLFRFTEDIAPRRPVMLPGIQYWNKVLPLFDIGSITEDNAVEMLLRSTPSRGIKGLIEAFISEEGFLIIAIGASSTQNGYNLVSWACDELKIEKIPDRDSLIRVQFRLGTRFPILFDEDDPFNQFREEVYREIEDVLAKETSRAAKSTAHARQR